VKWPGVTVAGSVCSVPAGDYRLIELFEDGRLELYNLRDDIEENHNLATAEPDIVASLHASLVEWRTSVEDKIPKQNPNFDPFDRSK